MVRMSIELLAPAGNQESFFWAIKAGADAVYVGMKDFSARSKAKNFSYKELYNLCNYAKEKKVKVYVALNTLLQQKDIKKAFECLQQIQSANADAVILQDLALAGIIKKHFPSLKLHASTQLAVHNSLGVKQAEKIGFTRTVLARELSFEQIKNIKKNTHCELEIFCHGALCFSVSGLCLFSSFIGGYSGNRGFCTQPCRRLWDINNKQGYFFSPKDLQLSEHIQKLKDIGITSLKIEGRMKTADYVYKTVKAYRLLIDADKNNMTEALKEAQEILTFDYARQKTSFNFIKNDSNIFEPGKSKNIGLSIGVTANKKNDSFFIETTHNLNIGDIIRIVDNKNDKSVAFEIKNIEKINNGYNIFYNDAYIENNFEIFKIADYNDKSEKIKIDEKEPQEIKKQQLYLPKFQHKIKLPPLFIKIDNFKWLKLLEKSKEIIVLKLTLNNLEKIMSIQSVAKYYIELPPFIEEEDIDKYSNIINFLIKNECKHFFINNISHFGFFENKNIFLYGGQFLYTLNSYTAETLTKFKVEAFTVSWEDDLSNVSETAKILNDKLIVYLSGFPELAVSKMICSSEIENQNIKSNKDEFKIINGGKNNVILPRYPITIFDLKSILLKFKINSFGIDLSYIEPNKNYLDLLLRTFYNNTNINSAHKFNFNRKLK